jgi:ABC-type cobalamin transport system permease subunit
MKLTAMRKSLLLLSFMLVITAAYSQKTSPSQVPTPDKEALLRKSRTQKAVGWFMVGTGAPVVLACLYFLTFPDDVLSEKELVLLALAGGAAYTLVGVDLIKKGTRNKERYLSLGLNKPMPFMPALATGKKCLQPAVSIHIQL